MLVNNIKLKLLHIQQIMKPRLVVRVKLTHTQSHELQSGTSGQIQFSKT